MLDKTKTLLSNRFYVEYMKRDFFLLVWLIAWKREKTIFPGRTRKRYRLLGQIWDRFKGKAWESFQETGRRAYGYSAARRYHLQLLWAELNLVRAPNDPTTYEWRMLAPLEDSHLGDGGMWQESYDVKRRFVQLGLLTVAQRNSVRSNP